ncbi:MAG: dehydrogenase [Bryobacterales bacterium]|nr:dehydrogenase [Bryobacterales bacterium]
MRSEVFRVGLSADFLDDSRQLVFPDIGLSVLDSDPGIEHRFLSEYYPEYTPEQLQGIDVLISLKPRVSEASLAGVERLCAIGRCGVGYDNVDIRACTACDIAVYITPAGVTRPMAESIVLLVLALSHNLVRKDRLLRQGRWAESTQPLGREPRGRTIGTIGFGNIAKEAVRLLTSFDVGRFLVFDPFVTAEQTRALNAELVSLEDLLRRSDYVLINCPLTAATRHLIGAPELRLMKPEAVLINTARGPIVDEAALIQALSERWIRAAALDVFEKEPLDPDSPLLQMDNVIVTSHSIGWTEELFRDMGRIDCEGALAVRRGQAPANVVNPDVLSRPGFQRKLERHRGHATP